MNDKNIDKKHLYLSNELEGNDYFEFLVEKNSSEDIQTDIEFEENLLSDIKAMEFSVPEGLNDKILDKVRKKKTIFKLNKLYSIAASVAIFLIVGLTVNSNTQNLKLAWNSSDSLLFSDLDGIVIYEDAFTNSDEIDYSSDSEYVTTTQSDDLLDETMDLYTLLDAAETLDYGY